MSTVKNNSILSEQLIDHYKLNVDPFQDDADVFFEGAQRHHNLETLRHMSTFGDMVLLLTGEKGAGKTKLIERFVEDCSADLNIYVADARSSELKEKKQSVISRFSQLAGLESIPGETTRQSFSRLMQVLEEGSQDSGLRSVLVFENADALPKKELQFYCSYFSQLPKESNVVAILTGAPALLQQAKLSNVDGESEWLHQIQLKPLGASDMLEYLQQRLEVAGFQGLLELSEMQVQHLIDIGKGLPGRVNRLFSSVVLEPGALKLPDKSSNKVPKFIFVGIGVLFGFSFLIVAYQYGMFGGVDSEVEVPQVVDKSLKSEDVLNPEVDRIEQRRAERIRMLDKALSESLINVAEEDGGVRQDMPAKASNIEKNGDGKVVGVDGQEVVGSEALKVTSEVERSLPNKAKKSLKIDSPVAKKLKSDDVVSSKKQKDDTKDSKPFFNTRSWVESQSMKAYSAQILGSYTEQTAIDFAQRVSKVSPSIYYLETLHRGKPWFVVFYGVFSDKASAQEAIKGAPKLIASQKPWLRRFDGILASYPK